MSNGQMNSFLGLYDRDLDEDPKEPICFEEQFILRVPREIAEGSGGKEGLKDMVKGKSRGLEGVEFKFLGESCGASFFLPCWRRHLPFLWEVYHTYDTDHDCDAIRHLAACGN